MTLDVGIDFAQGKNILLAEQTGLFPSSVKNGTGMPLKMSKKLFSTKPKKESRRVAGIPKNRGSLKIIPQKNYPRKFFFNISGGRQNEKYQEL